MTEAFKFKLLEELEECHVQDIMIMIFRFLFSLTTFDEKYKESVIQLSNAYEVQRLFLKKSIMILNC